MANKNDLIKTATEAHTNLNTFGAVIALMESGLLYGDSTYASAQKIIAEAKRAQQKELTRYDSAVGKLGAA